MRWASYDMKFTRPLRWMFPLGNDVVPIEIEGVPCGRESAGHRVLSKGQVRISNAAKYAEELKAAHVMGPAERRALIEEQVAAIAKSKSGTPKQSRARSGRSGKHY